VEDQCGLEVVVEQPLHAPFGAVDVLGVEGWRRDETARREAAEVGAEEGVPSDEYPGVLVDERVIVGFVTGGVDGFERADTVAVGVAAVGGGDAGLRLLRYPRLDVVPVDDRIETADMIRVAVGDDHPLGGVADLGEPLKQRPGRVLESGVDQRRDVVAHQIDTTAPSLGLLDGDVVHARENFVCHGEWLYWNA